MKYEIYQLKEDTMEQVKLRFMRPIRPQRWAASIGRTTVWYTRVMWKPERMHSRRLMACSADST